MLSQVDLDGETIRTLAQVTQVDLDGTTIRDLKELWQNDANGVPRLIFGSISVTVYPTLATATNSTPGSAPATTGSVIATPANGTTPYSYSWSATSGWSALSPTSSATQFRSTPVGPGETSDSVGTVTVTDANGLTASADVTLFANNVHA